MLQSMGSQRDGYDLVTNNNQTAKTFSISAIRLFHFLVVHVFSEVTSLISCKNFSFAFTAGPTDARGLVFSLIQLSPCLPH